MRTAQHNPLRFALSFAIALGLGTFFAPGCGDDDSPSTPDPPQPTGQVPDFTLPDMNPNSPTFGQPVTARQHVGQISAWYFGAAT